MAASLNAFPDLETGVVAELASVPFCVFALDFELVPDLLPNSELRIFSPPKVLFFELSSLLVSSVDLLL